MKRIEEIKDRFTEEANYVKTAPKEYLPYTRLRDVGWLIARLEKLEQALARIEREGQSYDTVEDCFLVAREALAEDSKEGK